MSYDANNAYSAGPGANEPGSNGAGAYGPGVADYGAGPGGFGPSAEIRGAASPEDLSLPLYGASFGQAIKRFFKNYVKFSGRASLSEFWFGYLFTALGALIPYLLLIVGLVMMSVSASADPSGFSGPSGTSLALIGIGGTLTGLFVLATIVPSIAVAWRRLHDANYSGLLYLLSLTGIGSIVLIVLYIMPSKSEGQRYDV